MQHLDVQYEIARLLALKAGSKKRIQLTWLEGILVLNFYGNLLLSVAAGTLYLAYLYPSVGSLCLAAAGVVLGVWGVAVTRRIPAKMRLANALLRRVHRQGYDPRFFRLTCKDFCTRLLTRYLHLRLGRFGQAGQVIRAHRHATGLLVQPGGRVLASLVESGQISEADLEAAVRLGLSATAQADQRASASG